MASKGIVAYLRAEALGLDEVEVGIACEGTALESLTFKTKKKAFLFLSATTARLKLEGALAQAEKLGCDVGANGWVKIDVGDAPPRSVLARWVRESHALFSRGASKAKPTPKKPKRK